MSENETEPTCYFCKEVVDVEEAYCHGCKHNVCEGCERNHGLMGPHHVQEHAVEGDF